MSFREDLVHIPKTTVKIRGWGGEEFLTELPNMFVSSVIFFVCVGSVTVHCYQTTLLASNQHLN